MTHQFTPAHWRRWLAAVAGLGISTALGLWAFNTLTALVGGPTAQYRHAVAALVLLAMVRWALGCPGYRIAAHVRSTPGEVD